MRATDDNGGGASALSVVERAWDSLSRLAEERQDGRVVSSSWSGDGKRLGLVYPGGRAISYTHDALDREKTIGDGGSLPIASYSWIGPGYRPLARVHGNGTALSLVENSQDVGYDAVQRLVRLRHLLPGGAAALVDRVYAYDRAGNRVAERRLDDGNLLDSYAHDSLGRIVASLYDQEGAAGAAQRELLAARYRLDGVGNRVEVEEDRLASGLGILAHDLASLGPSALVQGHVKTLPGASSAELQPDARVTGDVAAPSVALRPRARVDGRVSTNALASSPGASVGGGVGPYQPPAESIPAVSLTPGTQDVSAKPGQTVVLAPGQWGRVRLPNRNRLVFAAGTYELRELDLGPDCVVEVQGPVVLRAVKLSFGPRTRVVPAAGLRTEQVRWEVASEQPLQLASAVELFGVLVSPAGAVHLAQGSSHQGQVLAREVRVGPGAGVTSPGALGERSTRTDVYQVNAVNQYVSVAGVARGHDASGNLRDDGSRLFTYDYRNRMVGVRRKNDGAAIATYRYDALGRRIEKVVYSQQSPGAVVKATRFFWDAWDLIEEQGPAAVTECTYAGGVGVDEHVQWQRTASHPQGAGTFYLHQDARGNVVAITDASGAVAEKTRYDDFGRADHPSAIGLAFGFQGRYLDRETGLYEFRHRVYDPATGRFLQRDPVWDPLNAGNQYTLVGNNPATWGDPSGLLCPSEELAFLRKELEYYENSTIFNLFGGVLSPSGSMGDYQRLQLRINQLEGDVENLARGRQLMRENSAWIFTGQTVASFNPGTWVAEGTYVLGQGRDIQGNPTSRLAGLAMMGGGLMGPGASAAQLEGNILSTFGSSRLSGPTLGSTSFGGAEARILAVRPGVETVARLERFAARTGIEYQFSPTVRTPRTDPETGVITFPGVQGRTTLRDLPLAHVVDEFGHAYLIGKQLPTNNTLPHHSAIFGRASTSNYILTPREAEHMQRAELVLRSMARQGRR